jgi:hypothetical protein
LLFSLAAEEGKHLVDYVDGGDEHPPAAVSLQPEVVKDFAGVLSRTDP